MTTGYTLITLRRLDTTDKGIFGHMSFPGFDCVTLENDEKEIPSGTYKVSLYDSPHFGYKLPLLHDVPGRTMIEIHRGNTENDSKGCILVGTNRTETWIEGSKLAFERMMAAWPSGEVEIQIL